MVDNCTAKSAKFKSLGYTDRLVSLMGDQLFLHDNICIELNDCCRFQVAILVCLIPLMVKFISMPS